MTRGHVNPWLPVLVLVCAIATSMSLGRLHEFQGADSIVPILVSLQRWTPFFWQQDRFGMLVPLLAMPVRDPLINLAVQGWLMATAALIAPFLAARLLVDDPRRWFVAGAVANILLLLMPRVDVQFDWLVMQPYALSITLAAAGLVAIEHAGRTAQAAAVLLMVLAHWVNVGVLVLVVPFALLRHRFLARALAVTAGGAAAGMALTRLSPDHTTTAVLPPSEWPHAWFELLAKAPTPFPHPPALVGIAILASIAAVIVWIRSRPTHLLEPMSERMEQELGSTSCPGRRASSVMPVRDRQDLAAAGIALLVAVTYWLAAGTSRWVQINMYFPRYIYPGVLMCGVAVGVVAATVAREPSTSVTSGIALALCGLTLFDYGVPSPGRLRATIESRFGALTPDVITSGATVIGGNYWVVWPAVFHANLTTHRQNGHAVYGFTYRSAPTDGLWKNRQSDIVLAAPAGDRTIEGWAARAGLTIARIERRGAIDVFVIRKAG